MIEQCECSNYYRLIFTIIAHSYIYISFKELGTLGSSPYGAYGHEQRHIHNQLAFIHHVIAPAFEQVEMQYNCKFDKEQTNRAGLVFPYGRWEQTFDRFQKFESAHSIPSLRSPPKPSAPGYKGLIRLLNEEGVPNRNINNYLRRYVAIANGADYETHDEMPIGPVPGRDILNEIEP